MRLYLAAFGKLKTPGLREAADYYKRLLGTWIPLEEWEFKPLEVPDKSPQTRLRIQTREGELLLEKIKERTSGRGIFYLLDEKGKSLSTQSWCQKLEDFELKSIPHIVFCIGSSLGFSEALRKQSHGSFSLGLQTMSHELARVVLMEQLYRAYSLHKGHPYHNEGS